MESVPRTEAQTRLSAGDWLRAAFAIFLRDGVAAVRVEPLARSLGVTRGSFYWHFRDRDDLLRQLLEAWRAAETTRIIAESEGSGAAPAERLLRLMELCAGDDGRLELAIRSWAATDEAAASTLRAVDHARRTYLAELFAACGCTSGQAALRADLVYLSWLGQYMTPEGGGAGERVARMRAVHGFLTDDLSRRQP